MTELSRDQLSGWTNAIADLHEHITRHETDAELAAEAVANLWEDYGYRAGPERVRLMIMRAIEIGYAAAVRDVRDGDIDGLIDEWRAEAEDD